MSRSISAGDYVEHFDPDLPHHRAWLLAVLEQLVGLGVLLQLQPCATAPLVGAVAARLGTMEMMSVGKAVFIDHLALNCACVGGNFRTPSRWSASRRI